MARRLAKRLERNLDVRTLLIQEDGAPVSETWEEGAASDALLILLDTLTAPAPLRREAWEGLFAHDGKPPVAFIPIEDCAYPKLLERRPFFATGHLLGRSVEKWIAGMLPKFPGITPASIAATVPDDWWLQLVDQPGQVETLDVDAAQAFAHQARNHFQQVIWLGCAGREPAIIHAEMEHHAGVGRALIVFAYIDRPLKTPGGRHSYIHVRSTLAPGGDDAALGTCFAPCFPGTLAQELGGDVAQAVLLDAAAGLYRLPSLPATTNSLRQRHLELLQHYFQHWRHAPEPCRALLAEVPAAIAYGFQHDWPAASELCRRAAFLLLAEGRRREGIRMLHRLLVEAEAHGDSEAAADALHELSWLNDEDEPERAETVSGQQMNLFG